MDKLLDIISEYKEILQEDYSVYFSPGRINLIGEHIDYLGGNVFPSAISLGTYAFVSKRKDKELHFISHNFKEYGEIVISLDKLSFKEEDNWTNYAKGMFQTYKKKGHNINTGLNIIVYGTLPSSSGLSSSASLEVLIGTLIKEEYNLPITKLEIVLDSKDVENNYIGVNCGIMDQFAIGMAEKDHAIYLNTSSLEYKQIPLELGDYQLVIANTNKQRNLADSKYNERVDECNKSLEIIQNHGLDILELCQLNIDELPYIKSFLKHVFYKRVHHAVTEQHRTILALDYLEKSNIIDFGNVLVDSHISLRDDYEVSCIESDTLVDSFLKYGAIGSRMIGAGFGGSVIAIVEKEKANEIIKKVEIDYLQKIGYNTSVYIVEPSGGPRKICKEDLQ